MDTGNKGTGHKAKRPNRDEQVAARAAVVQRVLNDRLTTVPSTIALPPPNVLRMMGSPQNSPGATGASASSLSPSLPSDQRRKRKLEDDVPTSPSGRPLRTASMRTYRNEDDQTADSDGESGASDDEVDDREKDPDWYEDIEEEDEDEIKSEYEDDEEEEDNNEERKENEKDEEEEEEEDEGDSDDSGSDSADESEGPSTKSRRMDTTHPDKKQKVKQTAKADADEKSKETANMTNTSSSTASSTGNHSPKQATQGDRSNASSLRKGRAATTAKSNPKLEWAMAKPREHSFELSGDQIEDSVRLLDSILRYGFAQETSSMGAGKTAVAIQVAKTLRLPIVIVCMDLSKRDIMIEARTRGVPVIGIMNYEQLQYCQMDLLDVWSETEKRYLPFGHVKNNHVLFPNKSNFTFLRALYDKETIGEEDEKDVVNEFHAFYKVCKYAFPKSFDAFQGTNQTLTESAIETFFKADKERFRYMVKRPQSSQSQCKRLLQYLCAIRWKYVDRKKTPKFRLNAERKLNGFSDYIHIRRNIARAVEKVFPLSTWIQNARESKRYKKADGAARRGRVESRYIKKKLANLLKPFHKKDFSKSRCEKLSEALRVYYDAFARVQTKRVEVKLNQRCLYSEHPTVRTWRERGYMIVCDEYQAAIADNKRRRYLGELIRAMQEQHVNSFPSFVYSKDDAFNQSQVHELYLLYLFQFSRAELNLHYGRITTLRNDHFNKKAHIQGLLQTLAAPLDPDMTVDDRVQGDHARREQAKRNLVHMLERAGGAWNREKVSLSAVAERLKNIYSHAIPYVVYNRMVMRLYHQTHLEHWGAELHAMMKQRRNNHRAPPEPKHVGDFCILALEHPLDGHICDDDDTSALIQGRYHDFIVYPSRVPIAHAIRLVAEAATKETEAISSYENRNPEKAAIAIALMVYNEFIQSLKQASKGTGNGKSVQLEINQVVSGVKRVHAAGKHTSNASASSYEVAKERLLYELLCLVVIPGKPSFRKMETSNLDPEVCLRYTNISEALIEELVHESIVRDVFASLQPSEDTKKLAKTIRTVDDLMLRLGVLESENESVRKSIGEPIEKGVDALLEVLTSAKQSDILRARLDFATRKRCAVLFVSGTGVTRPSDTQGFLTLLGWIVPNSFLKVRGHGNADTFNTDLMRRMERLMPEHRRACPEMVDIIDENNRRRTYEQHMRTESQNIRLLFEKEFADKVNEATREDSDDYTGMSGIVTDALYGDNFQIYDLGGQVDMLISHLRFLKNDTNMNRARETLRSFLLGIEGHALEEHIQRIQTSRERDTEKKRQELEMFQKQLADYESARDIPARIENMLRMRRSYHRNFYETRMKRQKILRERAKQREENKRQGIESLDSDQEDNEMREITPEDLANVEVETVRVVTIARVQAILKFYYEFFSNEVSSRMNRLMCWKDANADYEGAHSGRWIALSKRNSWYELNDPIRNSFLGWVYPNLQVVQYAMAHPYAHAVSAVHRLLTSRYVSLAMIAMVSNILEMMKVPLYIRRALQWIHAFRGKTAPNGKPYFPGIFIVASYTDTMLTLHSAFQQLGIKVGVLNGLTPDKERRELLRRFAGHEGDLPLKDRIQVLIGQYTIVSTSINLDDRKGNEPKLALMCPNTQYNLVSQCVYRVFRPRTTQGSVRAEVILARAFTQQEHKALQERHIGDERVLIQAENSGAAARSSDVDYVHETFFEDNFHIRSESFLFASAVKPRSREAQLAAASSASSSASASGHADELEMNSQPVGRNMLGQDVHVDIGKTVLKRQGAYLWMPGMEDKEAESSAQFLEHDTQSQLLDAFGTFVPYSDTFIQTLAQIVAKNVLVLHSSGRFRGKYIKNMISAFAKIIVKEMKPFCRQFVGSILYLIHRLVPTMVSLKDIPKEEQKDGRTHDVIVYTNRDDTKLWWNLAADGFEGFLGVSDDDYSACVQEVLENETWKHQLDQRAAVLKHAVNIGKGKKEKRTANPRGKKTKRSADKSSDALVPAAAAAAAAGADEDEYEDPANVEAARAEANVEIPLHEILATASPVNASVLTHDDSNRMDSDSIRTDVPATAPPEDRMEVVIDRRVDRVHVETSDPDDSGSHFIRDADEMAANAYLGSESEEDDRRNNPFIDTDAHQQGNEENDSDSDEGNKDMNVVAKTNSDDQANDDNDDNDDDDSDDAENSDVEDENKDKKRTLSAHRPQPSSSAAEDWNQGARSDSYNIVREFTVATVSCPYTEPIMQNACNELNKKLVTRAMAFDPVIVRRMQDILYQAYKGTLEASPVDRVLSLAQTKPSIEALDPTTKDWIESMRSTAKHRASRNSDPLQSFAVFLETIRSLELKFAKKILNHPKETPVVTLELMGENKRLRRVVFYPAMHAHIESGVDYSLQSID